jgi:hypothetical protein
VSSALLTYVESQAHPFEQADVFFSSGLFALLRSITAVNNRSLIVVLKHDA